MFIQTEATPNPATLKFLPGVMVLPSGTAEFRTAEEASQSPLAEQLFTIPGVAGVFFGYDFISVTREGSPEEGFDWQHLKPAVLGTIMEHFVTGKPVMKDDATGSPETPMEEDFAEADTEIVNTIKELLETRVRPAVAQDGGDITFQGYRDGVVYLHMRGACAGCPSSTQTLKHGIQNLLKHFIPEIREVQPVGVFV
ncbi:MAG: NifU family protein [Rhizobiaceae bacterium]|nr:NifU family protein [Rhizobiaceae bacterium]